MAASFRQLYSSSLLITAHLRPRPSAKLVQKSITLKRFEEMGVSTQRSISSNTQQSKHFNTLTGHRSISVCSTKSNAELPISEALKEGLRTTESVTEFLGHLSEDQKKLLYHSLNVDALRDQSSKSESHQYLSRFGRPTATVVSNSEDEAIPCDLPARLDKNSIPPAGAVWAVGIKNALPFIGFGFLDNLIMILAGDYIDITIGTTLGISTMAAAALGNTISDVAGIGSAWYVEDFANKVGIKEPELTPSQFASWSIRWATNGGRAIGVVIGCLLGMVPLIFLPSPEEKDKANEKKNSQKDEKH